MTTSRQERLTAYRKKLLDDSFLASNIHVEDSMGYLEDILMNRKPITAEVSRWLKDGDRIALMRNIRYPGEKNITVILNDDTFQLEERIKIIEIYGAVNIESRQKSVTPKWLSNCAHVLKKELIVPESFFKPEEFFDYAMQYPVLLTYQKTVCPNAVLDEHRHGMFMLLHDANVVFSTSDIAKNSIITAIMDSQKKLNVERVCRQYLTEEDIKSVLEQTFFKLLEEHFSIDNLFPLFTEEQKIHLLVEYDCRAFWRGTQYSNIACYFSITSGSVEKFK